MSHREVPCRACGRPMIWLPTAAGKRQPCNAETVEPSDTMYVHGKHVSHFSDCPRAADFRKRDK